MRRRVAAQPFPLVGMFQEGQHAVADQVDGGFMPGHQQKEDHRQQLVLAQRVAGFLGPDQGADQVVAGIGPALLDDLADVAHAAPRRSGRPSTVPAVEAAAAMMAFDQRWNLWRSSTGTPSISAMIVVGKGRA